MWARCGPSAAAGGGGDPGLAPGGAGGGRGDCSSMPSTASFNSSALAACAPSTMLRMVPLPRGAGEDQIGDPYPARSLLDDDRAAHMRMHGAEVVVGPGLVENGGELLAAVDRLRSEDAVGADDVVRLLVVIDPGDRRP